MDIHEENLSDLTETAREHLETIEQDAPDRSYVVGGAVRDALMGREFNDLDWVVVGETPESMLERGFNDIQATSFPVFMDSEGMEWALARTENKAGDGYHGFEIETEDVTLREDLKRRDLTINAMALCLERVIPNFITPNAERQVVGEDVVEDAVSRVGNLHLVGSNALLMDKNDGLENLRSGLLCPVGPAFKDDPIRVMRLARYAARFPELEPSSGAIEMSKQVAYELNRCSRERVGDEIVKAMEQAREPRRFWEVLRDTGALAVIFPELDRATLVPAGPEAFHSEGDTFEHTMLVLERMYELCEEQDLSGDNRVRRLLMAVAHDIGKVTLADDEGGLLSDPPKRFGGHADVGRAQIPHIAQGLGLEKQYEKAMQDACEYHMDFFDVAKVLDVEDHHTEPYNAHWVRSFLDNFDHEHDPEESTIYGATPWEMLDLTHADHEGRIELRTDDDLSMSDVGNVYDVDIQMDGWDVIVEEIDDAEIEEVVPEFDREPYERVMSTVYSAIEDIDGYVVMREGMCEDHGVSPGAVHETLEQCNNCRTPGPWVGERIDELIVDRVIDELEQ